MNRNKIYEEIKMLEGKREIQLYNHKKIEITHEIDALYELLEEAIQMKTDLIELLKEYFIIEEKNGRYYSCEVKGDEVTIELYKIDSKLKTQEYAERIEFYKTYKDDLSSFKEEQRELYIEKYNLIHTYAYFRDWLFNYCFEEVE